MARDHGSCLAIANPSFSYLGFPNVIPGFFKRHSEKIADIGIVVDDEDRMGIRRISSVGHSYSYLPATSWKSASSPSGDAGVS